MCLKIYLTDEIYLKTALLFLLGYLQISSNLKIEEIVGFSLILISTVYKYNLPALFGNFDFESL